MEFFEMCIRDRKYLEKGERQKRTHRLCNLGGTIESLAPVSYTHLDVYKRQLEKREYLGHTINFKTRKHFKDKKSHYVPEDECCLLYTSRCV